jgi:hypothetical protein
MKRGSVLLKAVFTVIFTVGLLTEFVLLGNKMGQRGRSGLEEAFAAGISQTLVRERLELLGVYLGTHPNPFMDPPRRHLVTWSEPKTITITIPRLKKTITRTIRFPKKIEFWLYYMSFYGFKERRKTASGTACLPAETGILSCPSDSGTPPKYCSGTVTNEDMTNLHIDGPVAPTPGPIPPADPGYPAEIPPIEYRLPEKSDIKPPSGTLGVLDVDQNDVRIPRGVRNKAKDQSLRQVWTGSFEWHVGLFRGLQSFIRTPPAPKDIKAQIVLTFTPFLTSYTNWILFPTSIYITCCKMGIIKQKTPVNIPRSQIKARIIMLTEEEAKQQGLNDPPTILQNIQSQAGQMGGTQQSPQSRSTAVKSSTANINWDAVFDLYASLTGLIEDGATALVWPEQLDYLDRIYIPQKEQLDIAIGLYQAGNVEQAEAVVLGVKNSLLATNPIEERIIITEPFPRDYNQVGIDGYHGTRLLVEGDIIDPTGAVGDIRVDYSTSNGAVSATVMARKESPVPTSDGKKKVHFSAPIDLSALSAADNLRIRVTEQYMVERIIRVQPLRPTLTLNLVNVRNQGASAVYTPINSFIRGDNSVALELTVTNLQSTFIQLVVPDDNVNMGGISDPSPSVMFYPDLYGLADTTPIRLLTGGRFPAELPSPYSDPRIINNLTFSTIVLQPGESIKFYYQEDDLKTLAAGTHTVRGGLYGYTPIPGFQGLFAPAKTFTVVDSANLQGYSALLITSGSFATGYPITQVTSIPEYISLSAPSQSARIVFRNTGTATWGRGVVKLVPVPGTWHWGYPNGIDLPSAFVAQNQDAAFSLTLQKPATVTDPITLFAFQLVKIEGAQQVPLAIVSQSIYLERALRFVSLKRYTFDTGVEGWINHTNYPDALPPTGFVWSGAGPVTGGIYLEAPQGSASPTHGWWAGPAETLTPNTLYRIRYRVKAEQPGSSQVNKNTLPNFRLKCVASDFKTGKVTVLGSNPIAIGNNNLMPDASGTDYDVYFYLPDRISTDTYSLGFDIVGFSSGYYGKIILDDVELFKVENSILTEAGNFENPDALLAYSRDFVQPAQQDWTAGTMTYPGFTLAQTFPSNQGLNINVPNAGRPYYGLWTSTDRVTRQNYVSLEPDTLYAVEYTITNADQPDTSKVPSFRLLLPSKDFRVGDTLLIGTNPIPTPNDHLPSLREKLKYYAYFYVPPVPSTGLGSALRDYSIDWDVVTWGFEFGTLTLDGVKVYKRSGISGMAQSTIRLARTSAATLSAASTFVGRVNITARPQRGRMPLRVTFIAPAGRYNYRWDFGDKTTSIQKSPVTHTYKQPGTYKVKSYKVKLTITAKDTSGFIATGNTTVTVTR